MLLIESILAIGILALTRTVSSLYVPASSNTANTPLSLQCPSGQPAQNNVQVTRSLDVWPHAEDVICFRGGFFGGSLAHTQDCRVALGSLPGEHLPGTFHAGGNIADPYNLPKELLAPKCNITISIPLAAQDDTTWPCIGQRIDILINACKVGTDHDGHVGGQTWAGANKEMLVTIVKPGKEVPQGLYGGDDLIAPLASSTSGSLSNSSSTDSGTTLTSRSGSRFVKANAGTM